MQTPQKDTHGARGWNPPPQRAAQRGRGCRSWEKLLPPLPHARAGTFYAAATYQEGPTGVSTSADTTVLLPRHPLAFQM